MNLQSPKHVDQVVGIVCRQSRLRGLVGSLIVCSLLIGFVSVLRHRGVHWLAWGGVAALGMLLVPWFLADSLAKFSSANWLLRIGPEGVWINLRSYQNRHMAEADTVVHLRYEEIGSVRRHIDTWTTPAEPSSWAGTHWKRESLELRVFGESGQIAAALAEERRRPAAIKGTHQPVTVPCSGVVRIAWRGHGNDVVPPLHQVLDELGRRVKVEEPTRTDRGDWHELSESELDELVKQLVRSGDNLAAAQLLVRRRGLSSTEAHQFVEQQGTLV